ncbi:g7703 [Coccomyxa viridis]|uniref:G7703 protein n=1 Tax=Coccomyxa viridis TaxID=1274662 RepID=A0ABP1FYI0_9CHLO
MELGGDNDCSACQQHRPSTGGGLEGLHAYSIDVKATGPCLNGRPVGRMPAALQSSLCQQTSSQGQRARLHEKETSRPPHHPEACSPESSVSSGDSIYFAAEERACPHEDDNHRQDGLPESEQEAVARRGLGDSSRLPLQQRACPHEDDNHMQDGPLEAYWRWRGDPTNGSRDGLRFPAEQELAPMPQQPHMEDLAPLCPSYEMDFLSREFGKTYPDMELLGTKPRDLHYLQMRYDPLSLGERVETVDDQTRGVLGKLSKLFIYIFGLRCFGLKNAMIETCLIIWLTPTTVIVSTVLGLTVSAKVAGAVGGALGGVVALTALVQRVRLAYLKGDAHY